MSTSGRPELRRERFGDVALGAKPERDEQRAELLAAFLLQSQCALDAGGIELSAGDQDFAEAHGSVVQSHFHRIEKKSAMIARRHAVRAVFAGRIKALRAFPPARPSPSPDASRRNVAQSRRESERARQLRWSSIEQISEVGARTPCPASAMRGRDVVGRMRGAHESRLERRRREVDAGIEHRVEEAVEALLVARHHGVVGVRDRRREIDAEHPAHRLRDERQRRRAAPPPTSPSVSDARALASRS